MLILLTENIYFTHEFVPGETQQQRREDLMKKTSTATTTTTAACEILDYISFVRLWDFYHNINIRTKQKI